MDPFYELYRDAGLVPIEIGTNGILMLIAIVGIGLNLSLVYVTKKTKSLRSPCNILIALYALSASFLLSGYTIKFFVFLFGINFIPLRTCYFLIVVPTIGAGFAIDYSCALVWNDLPEFNHRGKHLIFNLVLIFCFISMAIAILIVYTAASQHWNKPVMCSYMDINYLPESATHTDIVSLFSYIGEFVCYSLMWLVICCGKTAVTPKSKKLALSLTILIVMSLFCYILGWVFYHLVIPMLQLDMFTIEYVIWPVMHGALLMAHSSITPILLFCSQEYLQAFRKCFNFSQLQSRVASVGLDNNYNSA